MHWWWSELCATFLATLYLIHLIIAPWSTITETASSLEKSWSSIQKQLEHTSKAVVSSDKSVELNRQSQHSLVTLPQAYSDSSIFFMNKE